jgi:hypothetical protein
MRTKLLRAIAAEDRRRERHEKREERRRRRRQEREYRCWERQGAVSTVLPDRQVGDDPTRLSRMTTGWEDAAMADRGTVRLRAGDGDPGRPAPAVGFAGGSPRRVVLMGRPERERFGLTVPADGGPQEVWLDDPRSERRWPLVGWERE